MERLEEIYANSKKNWLQNGIFSLKPRIIEEIV